MVALNRNIIIVFLDRFLIEFNPFPMGHSCPHLIAYRLMIDNQTIIIEHPIMIISYRTVTAGDMRDKLGDFNFYKFYKFPTNSNFIKDEPSKFNKVRVHSLAKSLTKTIFGGDNGMLNLNSCIVKNVEN